jgi:DNA-binding MarR family transcriptional regulator
MLLVHLSQHEGEPTAAEEASLTHMARHMRWERSFGERVVANLTQRGLVQRTDDGSELALTDSGRAVARTVMLR